MFTYAQNKAVFLLNKRMRLLAYQKRAKLAKEERVRKARKVMTEAYFSTIKGQEESTVQDSEEYVASTMGLKRSESQESLDASSSEDEGDMEIPEEIYEPNDTLEEAAKKRKTFLHALGVQIKLQNMKLLEDIARERTVRRGFKRIVRHSDRDQLHIVLKSRQRHERILRILERKHKKMVGSLGGKFDFVDKASESLKKKRKIVNDLQPSSSNEIAYANWRRYKAELKQFSKAPIGKLIDSSATPLPKIGKKRLKAVLSGTSGKSRARNNPLRAWAHRLNGTPQYGSSDGNNCLIFAIAYANGFHTITAQDVAAIRASLLRQNLVGVNANGFLPGYGNVIDSIAQYVLGLLLQRGLNAQPVTIHLETSLPGIQPVVTGQGPPVYIFHHGNHYWWLKPNG